MPDTRSISAARGEVKWFDPRKGFGFVIAPDGKDVFVHYSVIQGDGFRVLRDGSQVEFDAEWTDRGWKALRVVARGQDAAQPALHNDALISQPTLSESFIVDPPEVTVVAHRPHAGRSPRRSDD